MDERGKTKTSPKHSFNEVSDMFASVNWHLILTLILAFAISVYVLKKFLKGSSQKNAVAIVGLSGSGKTQLFSRLCHAVDVLSVTSVKESSGYLTRDSKKALIYDIPGHERIRYALFDKVKHQVRALVFLLDASTIHEEIRDVAEFLYTIFCDGVVQSCRVRVLIACNKQDLPSAKGCELIKSSLEKEMNLLRVTKSNQLKSMGEGGNNNSFLGYPDQDFEFAHLKPLKVSFAECVAAKGAQMEDITKWIDSIV